MLRASGLLTTVVTRPLAAPPRSILLLPSQSSAALPANDIPSFSDRTAPLWRSARGPSGGPHRLRWLSLLAAGILLTTACTPWREYFRNGFKVGPNFKPPPAPVAQHWIDANDQRVSSETGDLSHWWTVFNDPVLNTLIQTAYRQNLTLKDAGYRVLQSRAQLGIAWGGLFPQTQAMNGDYYRQGLSRNAANRSFVGTRFFDQWDYGFTLSWELDFWGRFRRQIESAGDTMNASIENYNAVLVTLLGDVATAYIQLRTYQRQIELTQQNVALQQQTLVLAEARFRGGNTSDLDVEQAKTIVNQTAAQVPPLEISARTSNNQLCILLGIPPEDLQKLIGPGPIPTAPLGAVAGVPADLLRRRPDVRQSEYAVAAQSAQIGVAMAELYPHISITGTLDYQSQNLGRLITPGSLQGTVGPTYTWNLLNYGRLFNNVRYQKALFDQLLVDYQQSVLNAAQEVENGMVTFVKTHQEAVVLDASVVAAQEAVKIALAQYRGGMVDFNRVALLETTLVTQQNLLAQARGQIATGLVSVYRGLGGGWEIRLQKVPDGPLLVAGPPPVCGPPLDSLPKPALEPPPCLPLVPAPAPSAGASPTTPPSAPPSPPQGALTPAPAPPTQPGTWPASPEQLPTLPNQLPATPQPALPEQLPALKPGARS